MYRVLCLLIVTSAADSLICKHRYLWHRRHRHHHFGHNDLFDDITKQMSEVNEILKSACNNDRTTETFENRQFVIKHQLPEYKEDYIDVVIKDRVIQTTAKKIANDTNQFRDLRIIPNNLDISKASWNYVDGNIIIVLPFLEDTKEFCVKDGEEIKLVPREKDSEKTFDIDVRFKEELVN